MDTTAKVLVGVDGSESSILALQSAGKIAPALGAEIHAITCWDFPQIYAGYVPPDFESFAAAATQTLGGALAEAYGEDLPAGLTSAVVRGPAPAKLVEAGEGAAMLIVGRRGHGGFMGMHLGSVSAACVAHATCPVLVVHTTAEKGSGKKHPERERTEGRERGFKGLHLSRRTG